MDDFPQVLTVKQVAQYLQIEAQSVYKMAQRNKIPSTKIAGQGRFKKDILDDWLTKRIKKHEAKEIIGRPIKVQKRPKTKK